MCVSIHEASVKILRVSTVGRRCIADSGLCWAYNRAAYQRSNIGVKAMASKRGKRDVDVEIDLHGMTVEDMRLTLQQNWPKWRGMRFVRIIHGRGAALKPEVERWCDEIGVPFATDAWNPGAMRIFPTDRVLPNPTQGNTLREAGLRLTPEEEAYLRDPEAMERARQEELRRKAAEALRRQAEAASAAQRRRRDDSLWEAEMARLDSMEKKGASQNGVKPRPPLIVPAAQIKHQEGYWRAELVRVADTDTATLTKQKRTGLDKLAPPMEPKPTPVPGAPRMAKSIPKRDVQADQALFEEELAKMDAVAEERRS